MDFFTSEKHYNTLNQYYRQKYKKKVFKITLNGNFNCPNKDGTVAYGGCSFCSSLASGDFAGDKNKPLKTQFNSIKKMMHQKWKDAYYIVYFQAGTNTHGPLEKLKTLFEEAINLDPNIVMFSIATRPDSLPEEVLDYLAELNLKMKVQVELGLQTIFPETGKLLNLAYGLNSFNKAVYELRKRNIEVVVHIINGLPFETKKMMLETVKYLNSFDIQGLKIHMLHILKDTKMGIDYLNKPWPLLSLDEYVDITVKQLRVLKKSIIIHRITGDPPKKLLIAPFWTLKKFVVSNEIDKKMRKYNYYQGDLYV